MRDVMLDKGSEKALWHVGLQSRVRIIEEIMIISKKIL